jgi:hypothetical protein
MRASQVRTRGLKADGRTLAKPRMWSEHAQG